MVGLQITASDTIPPDPTASAGFPEQSPPSPLV